jgi:hypothetical protein
MQFKNRLFPPPPKVLPQIVPFTFGEEQINIYDFVTVTCIVNKGDIPLEVSWWFTAYDDAPNIKKLNTNNGVLITLSNPRLSMLTIESVHSRHRGNYTCQAKNPAGITTFVAQLNVNGIHFN